MPHLTEHTKRSQVSRLAWPVLQPLVILLVALLPLTALAFPIYESAVMGTPGATVGMVVTEDQSLGVKFHVDAPVTTGSIGGYFSEYWAGVASGIVGAIVRLHGPNDFPNSFDLTTRDVLGKTRIQVSDPSRDFAGDLALTLTGGWYALVFVGSGSGNSQIAAMPQVNTDIGDPLYFFGRPQQPSLSPRGVGLHPLKPTTFAYFDGGGLVDGVRMFVNSEPVAPVPEPATLLLLGSGLIGLGGIAWRRNRQR